MRARVRGKVSRFGGFAERQFDIVYDDGMLDLGPLGTGAVTGPVSLSNWFQPWMGGTRGTIAHFPMDQRVIRVSGLGYRPPGGFTAAPATSADISLTGPDFARLIAAAGVDVHPRTPPGAPAKLELFGVPGKMGGGMLRMVLPIALLYVVGFIVSGISMIVMLAWGGRAGMIMLYVGVAVAGLVLYTVGARLAGMNRPPSPQLTLVVDGSSFNLWQGPRQLASGRPHWTAGTHYASRGSQTPVVTLGLPGLDPITIGHYGIGAPDWPHSHRVKSPRYHLGEVDWPILIELLGHYGTKTS